jgi:hypothetical protein
MKVGSLVVCIEKLEAPPDVAPYVKWVPIGDGETIYTVRAVDERVDMTWLLFEEGCIGMMPDGIEIHAHLPAFKEIQPPMSLEALMSEVEEFELFSV